MNVLFLMLAFPEFEKNPNQFTDLACEFVANGNNVYVITALEKKYKQDTTYRDESGISVLRVRCGNVFNIGFIRKGISMVTIPYTFIRALKKYLSDIEFDLIVYPTPPITLFKVVKYIKRKNKCKSYLILRDIFPQNAKDLGLMKNNLLFNYFRKIEQKLYDYSDHIGCMSEKNIEYIVNHNNVDRDICELLPNWKKIRKISNEGIKDYKKELHLENIFVAVFGGVIGIAQELEFLLELAKLYRNRDDIVFLLIGDGNQKKKLSEIIRREKLTNVMMKERIPSAEFAVLLRQCNVGLVNLNRNFTIPNIPSKILDYFEAGLPVLATMDKYTDFGQYLENTGAGLWSITGDIDTYQQNFEKLFNHDKLRKELGESGRKFLEKNLTVEMAYNTIMKHF